MFDDLYIDLLDPVAYRLFRNRKDLSELIGSIRVSLSQYLYDPCRNRIHFTYIFSDIKKESTQFVSDYDRKNPSDSASMDFP